MSRFLNMALGPAHTYELIAVATEGNQGLAPGRLVLTLENTKDNKALATELQAHCMDSTSLEITINGRTGKFVVASGKVEYPFPW